ncbi:MAG: MFS transporter [Myxococcota bacterium]
MTAGSDATPLEKVVILLSSSLTVMAGANLAPARPGLAAAFPEVDNIELLARLVLTLPALAIALAAPFAGGIVDRWGRRSVLLISLLAYAVAGTSGLYLSSVTGILVGRFFLGVAVAACMTAATTLIGDRFSGEARARFMGAQAAFMSIGGVVFVMSGGLLADFHWRGPFAVYGAALLIAALAVVCVREPGPESKGASAGEQDEAIPFGLISALSAFALCGMILMYLIPTQLPFHLQAALGSSSTEVGLAIGSMTGAGAVGSLCFPLVARRLGSRPVFAVTFSFPAVGFFALSYAESLGAVVGSTLTLGFGLGFLMPAVSTWVTRVTPPAYRGRVIGAVMMCFFLGQFLAPIVAAGASRPVDVFAGASLFSLGLVVVAIAWSVAVRFRSTLAPKVTATY